MFKLLKGDEKESYVKRIKKSSNFKLTKDIQAENIWSVQQSEIVNNFRDKKLFNDQYYKSLDHSFFEAEYDTFAEDLKTIITHNIQQNTAKINLEKATFKLDYNKEKPTYYPIINESNILCNDVTSLEKRTTNIKKILNTLITEIKSSYYNSEQKNILIKAYNSIREIYKEILSDYYSKSNSNTIINSLIECCKEYSTNISSKTTTLDKEINKYQKDKEDFIKVIMDYLHLENDKTKDLKKPKIIRCVKDEIKNGYIFRRVSKYNDIDVLNEFFIKMFNSNYRTLENIYSINTLSTFQKALKGCTKIDEISTIWTNNLESFKEE